MKIIQSRHYLPDRPDSSRGCGPRRRQHTPGLSHRPRLPASARLSSARFQIARRRSMRRIFCRNRRFHRDRVYRMTNDAESLRMLPDGVIDFDWWFAPELVRMIDRARRLRSSPAYIPVASNCSPIRT